MKNTVTRILLVALMITAIVSSLAIGTSAAETPDETKLLTGLDFDKVAEAGADSSTHIYNNYGILFNNDSAVIQNFGTEEAPDNRLFIKAPTQLNASQNPLLEELFFSKEGPSRFKLEMDVAILKDFDGTGDENQKYSRPTSAHRGFTLLNIGNAWLLKATAPGVGALTVVKGDDWPGTTVQGYAINCVNQVTAVAPVAEDDQNKGYFYTYEQQANYWYTAGTGMGWADASLSKYTTYELDKDGKFVLDETGAPIAVELSTEATEEDKKLTAGKPVTGYISGAIAAGAIGVNPTYTLEEEVHLSIEFYKIIGGDNCDLNIYVDGVLVGTTSYKYTTTTASAKAIKFTDLADGEALTIDDMKITVLDCNDDHDSKWNTAETMFVASNNNAFAYDRVCTLCGGIDGDYPNAIKNVIASASIGNNKTYVDNLKNYWSALVGTTDAPADPWWLNFDLKVTSAATENEGERESFVTIIPFNSSGTDGGYNQILNVHKTTVDNGNGTETVKSKVSLGKGSGGFVQTEWTLYFEVGKSYSFHILIDPSVTSSSVSNYHVYVTEYDKDGNVNEEIHNAYLGSAHQAALKAGSGITYGAKLRFGDARAGEYTLYNLTYTRNITAENHSHVDNAEYRQNTVYVDGTTVEHTVYECYCGKNHVEEINSVVVDTIENLSGGTKTLVYTAPEGEYWVTTDMNLNTITTDGALLTLGETPVLKLEGGKLVSGDYSVTAKATAYSVAVKIKGTAYTLYLDGDIVASGTLAGDKAVTYGAEGLDATFNYNKIVTLAEMGEGEKPAVPTVGIDPSANYCLHSVSASGNLTAATASTLVDYRNNTKVAYFCKKCGDRVYDELVDSISLYTDSALKSELSSSFSGGYGTEYYYDVSEMGKNAAPYWIDFDYTLTSLPSKFGDTPGKTGADGKPSYDGLWNNGGGRSGVNFQTNYNSFVRVYPVTRGSKYQVVDGASKVTSMYFSDHILYRVGNTSNTANDITQLYVGDKMHISVYVDPVNADIAVYLNGEHVCTYNGYLGDNTWSKNTMRFGDGTSYPGFKIDNFRILRTAHKHTPVYSDDLSTNSADSWFGLDTYTCYCGEKVIKSAIASNESSAISDKIAGQGPVTIPTTTDFWFATDIHVAELSGTALITVGDNTLLSIKENNFVGLNNSAILKEDETPYAVSAKNTYQIAIQFMPAGNAYNYDLYIDGNYIGRYNSNVALTDTLTLGSEGIDVNFLYTKVVKLGADYFGAVAPTYTETYSADHVHTEATEGAMFITVPGETYTSGTKGVNKLIHSYICTTCGERVYEMQGEVLKVNAPNDPCPRNQDNVSSLGFDIYGNMSSAGISSHNYIRTDIASVGPRSDPFWIYFDLSATISSTQVGAIVKHVDGENNNKNNGGSILTIRAVDANSYVHILRGYGVLLSEEDLKKNNDDDTTNNVACVKVTIKGTDYYYYDDCIGISPYQHSRPTSKAGENNFAFIMKSGDTHSIGIYVDPDPANNQYNWTVYADGEKQSVHTTSSDYYNELTEHLLWRILDGNYGSFRLDNLAFVKAVKGETVETALPENMTFGNKVSVFELTAKVDNFTTEDAYYPLVTFNREYSSLTPIFVNASTGDLAYKKTNTEYTSLGYALTSEASDIVIVFDEMTNTLRYHLPNGIVDNVRTQHSYFHDMDAAEYENISLLTGGDIGFKTTVTLKNAYNMGVSGTSEVIGFQVNGISGDIRIISGISTEYYSGVGGYVELYDADDKLINRSDEVSNDIVFSKFNADDYEKHAEDYGYKYVSIVNIKWKETVKFVKGTSYYIIFRPLVVVEGTSYYGEPVKINITYDDNGVGFAFDADYSIKSVSENLDYYTYTMPKYDYSSTNNLNNGKLYTGDKNDPSPYKVMTPIIDGMGGADFSARLAYYEFKITPNTANDAYIVIDSDAALSFNIYLNGATVASQTFDIVPGRNYVLVEDLEAGATNAIKLERQLKPVNGVAIFNGILFDGVMGEVVAEENPESTETTQPTE